MYPFWVGVGFESPPYAFPTTHCLALAALLVPGLQLLTPGLPCLGLRRDESGKVPKLCFQHVPSRAASDLLRGKNSHRFLQALHSRSIDQNLKALLFKRLGKGSMRDIIRGP